VVFKQLEYLDLSENRIQTIEPLVFQSLTELKWLNLNLNKISYLPHRLLLNSIKLGYLSLYANEISKMHPDIFSDSSPLKHVDLRENEGILSGEYTCNNTECPIKLISDDDRIRTRTRTGLIPTNDLTCRYLRMELYLWPEYIYCQVVKADISEEDVFVEFTGTEREKQETTAVQFLNCRRINFIPVEMFHEFPSLNGLSIELADIPILKNGLFIIECEKIEFLSLAYNEIEVIELEPLAFKNLTRLLRINLEGNFIKSLKYRVFAYNLKLTYISFNLGSVEMINRKVFRNLKSLKFVGFGSNKCIDDQIECHSENCNQEFNRKMLPCFQSCSLSEDCKKASKIRVRNRGSSSSFDVIQTLNCAFRNFSEPHTAKFCEVEDADFSDDTQDAEFSFQGSDVEKNGTTGVYFTKCHDVDFVPTQIFKDFPAIDSLGIKYSYVPVLEITFSVLNSIRSSILCCHIIK
jgi:Leucine-rich repeat (LRR) protein